jgi:hypothetical protein
MSHSQKSVLSKDIYVLTVIGAESVNIRLVRFVSDSLNNQFVIKILHNFANLNMDK